jgi:hypothetical protein
VSTNCRTDGGDCVNILCRQSAALLIKLSAKGHVIKGQEIISQPSGDGSVCLSIAGRQMLAIALLLVREVDLALLSFPFLGQKNQRKQITQHTSLLFW